MSGSGSRAAERTVPVPGSSALRQLAAASVGNAAEWYDWYAYSFLAVYFAGRIFPKGAGGSLVPLKFAPEVAGTQP